MAQVRIGINGMGRIGRTIVREVFNRELRNVKIVSLNNPGHPQSYIHLLTYDSIHGKFGRDVDYDDATNTLSIDGQKISWSTHGHPSHIDWATNNVDVVIDATGIFKDRKSLGQHLMNGRGAKKVILCAPGDENGLDGTFVMGINHRDYVPSRHHIISNASCTTNCLAPVAKVIHENWEIETGFINTVHAYTSDQELLDGAHKDWRRSRAAALSIIPTSTGAAKALGLVLPELAGKLDGLAIRVPTPDVSLLDLTVTLKRPTTAQDTNQAIKEAAEGELEGILSYTEEPLVGQDFRGHRASAIVDLLLTNTVGNGHTLKIISWYDNEVGFSNRLIELAQYITTT